MVYLVLIYLVGVVLSFGRIKAFGLMLYDAEGYAEASMEDKIVLWFFIILTTSISFFGLLLGYLFYLEFDKEGKLFDFSIRF